MKPRENLGIRLLKSSNHLVGRWLGRFECLAWHGSNLSVSRSVSLNNWDWEGAYDSLKVVFVVEG